ncbi:hypothetical protein ACFPZL_09615 [Leucobacter soli]|uniref:Uncharacterized protein n=1 Tax=Leucobacter soli TaxID=2812850 RepID=A0A916K0I7_9MICO|nr:hypothetical protein [Leucobacter soli]CAG7622374.1 hypothetical protein LEUCIP111803_02510 [Leucobacter soli]
MGLDETSARIIRAVKAEAARRGVTGKALAGALGRDKKYVYERFRFEKPFATSDLEPIASRLGITAATLFASAALEEQVQAPEVAAA